MLIKKLQLLTDNLEETGKFYGQILGLPVLHKSDSFITFLTGESELSFHLSTGERPKYHFAFNIPCNQIEQAFAWMEGKSTPLLIEGEGPIADFSNWNAKAFYFLDNNENILEFIARNDLQNPSDDHFSSRSILSISEMGVVGDDVGVLCQHLMTRFGLHYFAKQPPLPKFAALGDDHGLLIVVPHKRNWYPTAIPSGKHWAKVHMEIAGREEVLEMQERN